MLRDMLYRYGSSSHHRTEPSGRCAVGGTPRMPSSHRWWYSEARLSTGSVHEEYVYTCIYHGIYVVYHCSGGRLVFSINLAATAAERLQLGWPKCLLSNLLTGIIPCGHVVLQWNLRQALRHRHVVAGYPRSLVHI